MVDEENSSQERVASGRDWTKGNIVRNILLLSWPIIILNALWIVNLVLEMIWIGKLGAAAIAGVGIAGFVYMLVLMIKSGVSIGERAMVARFIGSGDVATANHVTGQGYIIDIAYGAVIAAIGILFTEPIFSLFDLEASAVTEGVIYLRIVLIGSVTEAFWSTSFTVMQASGDSVTPMKVAIVIRSVNVVLCPFLVLGWWVFPRLGVSGAGITYIIVPGLGMLISLWVLFTRRTRLQLTLRDFRPDFKIIWRLLKIGIPASVMGLARTFGDLALTWFMVPFGTLAVAAHSLINRIELFLNMPGMSLGMGAGVLVGQNLGADRPKRASRSGWVALGLVEGFMVICSVILLVWAENIISLFNADPELVKLGGTFLRIAVSGYLGMAVVWLMQYCISGAGDTLPPMFINLAMLWVVQLPLAFFLSRFTELGMYGVRWALVAGFIIGAIAYITYFWQGMWKRKKL